MTTAKLASDQRHDMDGWDKHRISQLRQFRFLSLRAKLEALESMADVVRRFRQMRREGKFHSSAPRDDSVDES